MKSTLLLLLFVVVLPFQLLYAGGDPVPPVKGRVLTADGQPAASVVVRVKSNGRTTLTDDEGAFTLSNLPAGEYDLEISLVGFAPTTQHVVVDAHHPTTLSIRLQVSEQQLQDVVV